MTQTRYKPGPTTWFFRFARVVLLAFSAIFYPCRLINPEKLEAMDAPYLLIANHQSMMDPVLLAIHLKRYEIRFMGKRELTRCAPLAWIVRKLHMIPVSRHQSDIAALRASLDTLRAGNVLGVFPEGTRFRDGEPLAHIESGFLVLALRSQVPILPVYVHGVPRPFRRVSLLVGDPISFETLRRENSDLSHEDMKEHIRSIYRQLRDEIKQKKYNLDGLSA